MFRRCSYFIIIAITFNPDYDRNFYNPERTKNAKDFTEK